MILPFSMSLLCAALAGCGGESNTIHENPTVIPDGTDAIGCTVSSTSSACFEFLMEYPISGLQYTCTSDKVNTFSTKLSGNVVTGGCDTKDTVTFFLNATDEFRIEFGSVKLSDLGFVSASKIPVHLTVLDMAAGLTGKKAQSLDPSDETVKVALKLIKILQAIGSQKTLSNQIGDVQAINLTSKDLTGLNQITAKVDLAALNNNQYIKILQPWIDVSKISDVDALNVLKQITNVTFGSIYQADPPVVLASTEGLIGYAGTGTNQKTLLGTFFLMSDRQGYTHGYGLQWRGVPNRASESIGNALTLLTETNPILMRADAQTDWIDPISKRIGTAEKFKFVTTNNENLFINQGRLLNDYGVAGSEVFYKYLSNQSTVVKDDLSKWTQTVGTDQFNGHVDLVKAYPIAYLDKRVFKSEKTVAKGEKIYFPLYATLTFRQDDSSLKDVKLGIVIDEFGDIRTDIKKDATEIDMSGNCGIVADASVLKPQDHYGVQQYRIGTVSAANYQPQQQDLAISPRIILAGQQYGLMDGTLLGVNSSLIGTEGANVVNNNGVKINLYNLMMGTGSNVSNINISNYTNGSAEWVNIYHSYKRLFINSMKDEYTPTALEKEQVKSIAGSVGIQLASCYQVKTKA